MLNWGVSSPILCCKNEICMYSKKKSRTDNVAGRKTGGAAQGGGQRRGASVTDEKRSRRQLFFIIGIVVVILLAIVAIPYYQNYVAPFNKIIIQVDDEEVTVRYFLERAQVAGADPMSMLESLTNELVLKITAPRYGIEVTEEDIDQELRSMASDGTGEISDVEFKEWYRQELNETKISDDRYRELVGISLLYSRMEAYLAEQVPYEAEQVHLHIILISDYDEGLAVKERLDAGEDFAAVAREVSIDGTSSETGGDIGWMPTIISAFEYEIGILDVNEISAVMPYYSSTTSTSESTEPDYYYILKISEKDDARTLTEEHRAIIQTRALEFWLAQEIPQHDISYDFDSESYAWLSWQLEKRSASD